MYQQANSHIITYRLKELVTVHGISSDRWWGVKKDVYFLTRGVFLELTNGSSGSTARVALTALGHIVH